MLKSASSRTSDIHIFSARECFEERWRKPEVASSWVLYLSSLSWLSFQLTTLAAKTQAVSASMTLHIQELSVELRRADESQRRSKLCPRNVAQDQATMLAHCAGKPPDCASLELLSCPDSTAQRAFLRPSSWKGRKVQPQATTTWCKLPRSNLH